MTDLPWFYDYGTHEVVRASDGLRWSADDVPEFRRSIEEWATNPIVDVAAIDRWVLAQGSETPAMGAHVSAWLMVACPKCPAISGEQCHYSATSVLLQTGRRRNTPHKERRALARQRTGRDFGAPAKTLDLMAALKESLKQNPAAGDTATGRGAGAVESPASVPNLARLVKESTHDQ